MQYNEYNGELSEKCRQASGSPSVVIHKNVPSVGVILLTALVFTLIGAFIGAAIFFARFFEIKTLSQALGKSDILALLGLETPLPSPASSSGTPSNSHNAIDDPSGNTIPYTALPDVIQSVQGSVVLIDSYAKKAATESSKISTGTGFALSVQGYIITNQHVVQNAAAVKVTNINGNTYLAKVIGGDLKTDIAVLEVPPECIVEIVRLGASADVRVGDFVFAIGHPTGESLKYTSTFGMVSAIDRDVNIEGQRNSYIQIDAAINPGNSGGPLFDMKGNVIGVNSAKATVASYDEHGAAISAEGLGFALPIDAAIEIANQLIANGQIIRAGIGVSLIEVTAEDSESYDIPQGLLVYSVLKDAPGHVAGLYADDIIVKADGVDVYSMDDLSAILSTKTVGDSVAVTYWRSGQYLECKIVLGDLNTFGTEVLDNAYGGKYWNDQTP